MWEHFSDTGLYAKPIKFTRSIPTMPITKLVLIQNCTTNDYYHMKIWNKNIIIWKYVLIHEYHQQARMHAH